MPSSQNSKAKPTPQSLTKLALALEGQKDIRGAEGHFREAVASADGLPIQDYVDDFLEELKNYHELPGYSVSPGVDAQELKSTYHKVLILPFATRFQLAAFYARNGAFPEAKEAIEDALHTGIEPLIRQDPSVNDLIERATEFLRTIDDVIGPENLSKVVATYFKKIDVDKNGFLHEDELRRAQFDLSIDSEGQKMIRHLLYHYLEVEASSHDEWGVDISGISHLDVQTFEQKRKRSWKRLPR